MSPGKLGVLVVAGLALSLSACAQEQDVVRPLLDPGQGNYEVVSYEDVDVQEAAVKAASYIANLAREEETFDVDIIKLHEVAYEMSFISSERSPALYSGGTETASVLLSPEQALVTMSGSEGVCWAVRLSGSVEEPRTSFGSIFSPRCAAGEVAGVDITWLESWPPRALPEPGKEYPQVAPPVVPGNRPGELPAGVAPSQVPQQ